MNQIVNAELWWVHIYRRGSIYRNKQPGHKFGPFGTVAAAAQVAQTKMDEIDDRTHHVTLVRDRKAYWAAYHAKRYETDAEYRERRRATARAAAEKRRSNSGDKARRNPGVGKKRARKQGHADDRPAAG